MFVLNIQDTDTTLWYHKGTDTLPDRDTMPFVSEVIIPVNSPPDLR